MVFRLLGPLEVELDGKPPAAIPAPRQQVVLALLLLEAGHVVSVDRLVDAVWGDNPPRTARTQVQITISALRRILGEVVVTQPPGYLLDATPDDIDLACFEKLAASGAKAAEEQRFPAAVSNLRAALALWHGPALEGVQSEVIRAAATRLNEWRISAYQDCLDFELQIGRHSEIIGELTSLVAEYPLDERFRGQLMLALYRAGRQAGALEAFRVGREVLQEELGLDPSVDLCRLEQAIITRDKRLDLPGPRNLTGLPGKIAAATVPRQLPRTIADFTGRDEILAEISQVVTSAPLDVPVVVLTGRGGMGKTALAVRAAHLLSPEFPDGQIFLELRAYQPEGTASLLGQLLHSFGVQVDAMPPDLEGRATMYRSLLAGLRVLVVIDSATDEDHLTLFLPGTCDCAAIVTSSQQITAVEGVHLINVGPLDEQSASSLLENLTGAERVSAEPEATRQLISLCEGVPLALRVVAAKLRVRPHWRISHMVAQLQDETRRLDQLDLGGSSVRATVALAYETLDKPAQRLLRLLSLLGTADFASWVAAPLLDADIGYAEDQLQQLISSHLLETDVIKDDVRFHLHDLVRIYALERLATDESTADRVDAMRRLLGCWLFISTTAHRRIYGGDFAVLHGAAEHWPLHSDSVTLLLQSPIDWFRAERTSLITAINQAAQLGMDELCWDLAVTAATLFESGIHGDDWRDSHACALEAVRGTGNKRGEAALLYSLGTLEAAVRANMAENYFEQSLKIFSASGDHQGQAMALSGLALIDTFKGDYEQAQARYRQAIAGFREVGDLASEAYTLKTMAQISADQLDYAPAEQMLDDALSIARKLGAPRLIAQVQYVLAELDLRRGRVEPAADAFNSVVSLTKETGDVVGQAYSLVRLGNARRMLGDVEGAESALGTAFDLARSAGDRLICGRSLTGLAELHLARDEEQLALTTVEEAIAIFRKHGTKGVWLARALELLGRIHERSGKPGIAVRTWQAAAELAVGTDPALADQIAESLARLQAAGSAE